MITIQRVDKKSVILIGLLVFSSLFVISHVVYALGFTATVVVSLSLVVLLFIMAFHNRPLSIWYSFFLLFSLSTASISGVYWTSWKVFYYSLNIGASLLLVSIASKAELENTVSTGSVILTIILFGAWIAFLLQIFGIDPVANFVSAGGREIPFYYTSLATEIWTPFGTVIRPNGIYDEPGVLSFVVCLFAFYRHMMGMRKNVTWSLLLLGFITFSVAHIIYVFIHFLSEQKIAMSIMKASLISILILAISTQTLFLEYLEYALVSRLTVSTEDDRLFRGDNRSRLLMNAASVLSKGDIAQLMFGVDISTIEGSAEWDENNIEVGQNPLGPLVRLGLLIAWPYYLFLLFAIGFGIKRREYWPLLGVALLFMQRPSVMSSGYGMLAALTVIISLRWIIYKMSSKTDLPQPPALYLHRQNSHA